MKGLFLGALLLQGLNAQVDDFPVPAIASDPIAPASDVAVLPDTSLGSSESTLALGDPNPAGAPSLDVTAAPIPDTSGNGAPEATITSAPIEPVGAPLDAAPAGPDTTSFPVPDFRAPTSGGVLGAEPSATDIGLSASDAPKITGPAAPFLVGTADVILSTLATSLASPAESGAQPAASLTASGRFGGGVSLVLPLGPGAGSRISTSRGLGGLIAPSMATSRITFSPSPLRGQPIPALVSSRLSGGRIPPQPSAFPGPSRPSPVLAPNPGKSQGNGKFGGLSVGDSNPSPGSGKTTGKNNQISGLSVGDASGSVSGLRADDPASHPDYSFSDSEDDHRHPEGWDGEDNGIYDGEHFDPSGYYKKYRGKKGGKKGKKVGKKGKGWDSDSDSDEEDCPKWCLESDHDSDSSDDEKSSLKKKKKVLRLKKVKTTGGEPEPEDLDHEPSPGREKMRRLARPQDPPSTSGLSGFTWPDKKSSINSEGEHDSAHKGKKSKGKRRCPKKCRGKSKGKGKSQPSGGGNSDVPPSPTTLVTYTTVITNDNGPTGNSYPNTGSGSSLGPSSNIYPPPGSGSSNSNTLAGLCPTTCNPFDPAANKCDQTAPCVTTGSGRYYCACRAGYRFDGMNSKDFGLQFKVDGQPFVYGVEERTCNTLCSDTTCTEVPVRQQCA